MEIVTAQYQFIIECSIYLGNLGQALHILDPLLESQPDEPTWYRLKLLTSFENMKTQEVQRLGFLIRQKFPFSPERDLAEALMPGLSASQRERRLNSAISRSPGDPFLYYLRAKNSIYQGKSAHAIRDLKMSLQLEPDFILAEALSIRCLKNSAANEG